jgi:hypothetical protein
VHAYRVGGTLDIGLLGVRFVAGALSSALRGGARAPRRGDPGSRETTARCPRGNTLKSIESRKPIALVS